MVEVSAASVGVLVEVHAASKLTVMVGEPLERVGNGDESPLSPLLDTSSAATRDAVGAQQVRAADLPIRHNPDYRSGETRIPFSPIRRAVARQLKQVQNTAAVLTTFNDIDMTNALALVSRSADNAMNLTDSRAGLLCLFARACCAAIAATPIINAAIDGDEIIHRTVVDLTLAIATADGAAMPVIRSAAEISTTKLELLILDLELRARKRTLSLAELGEGTFTLSDQDGFGSLFSSPFINPRQSVTLKLNRIEDRPVVIGGKVVARPMMYVAVSYDHRLIDGREAVTFLKTVKSAVEDPLRLVLMV